MLKGLRHSLGGIRSATELVKSRSTASPDNSRNSLVPNQWDKTALSSSSAVDTNGTMVRYGYGRGMEDYDSVAPSTDSEDESSRVDSSGLGEYLHQTSPKDNKQEAKSIFSMKTSATQGSTDMESSDGSCSTAVVEPKKVVHRRRSMRLSMDGTLHQVVEEDDHDFNAFYPQQRLISTTSNKGRIMHQMSTSDAEPLSVSQPSRLDLVPQATMGESVPPPRTPLVLGKETTLEPRNKPPATLEQDYGYETCYEGDDIQEDPEPAPRRIIKRRSSITKFNVELDMVQLQLEEDCEEEELSPARPRSMITIGKADDLETLPKGPASFTYYPDEVKKPGGHSLERIRQFFRLPRLRRNQAPRPPHKNPSPPAA
eukprot:scaffold241_cov89-Cylindrotheca_fusiformis.AAC.6